MSFSFHPEAEDELDDAIDYYEGIEPGLGYDFALEVHSTIKRTVEFPKARVLVEGEIRRSLVKRFPYGILYSEERNRDIHRRSYESSSRAELLGA